MLRMMLVAVMVAVTLGGCGSTALKRVGESCASSSECDKGLLCDLTQHPAVCADKGSLDAAVATPDAGGHPGDARASDAHVPVDAPVDAAPDAI